MRVMFFVQRNRFPLSCSTLLVDALRLRRDRFRVLAVLLRFFSRWRGNLEKGELFFIFGIFQEEVLNAFKSLQNSFCVIKPVYAKSHKRRVYAETPEYFSV